jgi:hypothetical protein
MMEHGKVRIEFVVTNGCDRPMTLFIEPWAEEFPMRRNSDATVVCASFNPAKPAYLEVTDGLIILHELGDDVRVRCDGRERRVGEID